MFQETEMALDCISEWLTNIFRGDILHTYTVILYLFYTYVYVYILNLLEYVHIL